MKWCNNKECEGYEVLEDNHCSMAATIDRCLEAKPITDQKEPVADVPCSDRAIIVTEKAGPGLTWGELKKIALEREVPDDFTMEVVIGCTAPVRFNNTLTVRDNKVFVMYKPC